MAHVPVIGASSSLGRLQRDEAHKECAKLLKSEIEREVREAHPLLEVADGKTLVEVLTPILPAARLALMLLAVAEGKTNAVMLHGLWGSARSNRPLARRLFRAVYENCGKLDSEGCRMALLKLYYLQF
jgi:predicted alpha/beta-fold hydrolase